MSKTCSECTYLKVNGDKNYGKYYCEKLGEWKYATEAECYRFCTAYSRSDRDIKEAYKFSESSQSTGPCYITTTLCHILSMNDDNEYLNTLRKFRKNYLQKNEEGLKILVKYDEVGPEISKSLSEYGGKLNVSLFLLQNYIAPITAMINSQKYDQAISSYTEMTNKLMKFFNIEDKVTTNVNDVVPELSGHGQIIKRTASKSLA